MPEPAEFTISSERGKKNERQWPVLDFANVNNSQAIRYLIEQIIANGDDSSETDFQNFNTHTTKTPCGERWHELATDWH